MSPPLTAGEARRLHFDSFVFDGHNDSALRIFEGEPLARRTDRGHLDLPRMREGGMDGGIFAVWIEPPGDGPGGREGGERQRADPLERSLEGVRRLRRWLEETDGFHLVLTPGDLERAEARGEVAAVIGVEGGYGITDDLSAVDRLREAGMRCLTLTWMRSTAWADASGVEAVHGGLSPFGERVVDRLQELGVLIDLSHASDATAAAVLERTEVPVAASHSGVRAVTPHHRNLPDRLLEALAGHGGVVGMNFFSAYLDMDFSRGVERLQRELRGRPREEIARAAREQLAPVPFSRLIEHFEHAIYVAGAGHVGLGSDFDGVLALPEGMVDVTALPEITAALARAGHTAAELRAILGGNFRRVLEGALG